MSGHVWRDTGDTWGGMPVVVDDCSPRTTACLGFCDIRILPGSGEPQVGMHPVLHDPITGGHPERRRELRGIPGIRPGAGIDQAAVRANRDPLADLVRTAQAIKEGR